MFKWLFKKNQYFIKITFNKYPEYYSTKYAPIRSHKGNKYNNQAAQYIYSARTLSTVMDDIRAEVRKDTPNAHNIDFVSITKI